MRIIGRASGLKPRVRVQRNGNHENTVGGHAGKGIFMVKDKDKPIDYTDELIAEIDSLIAEMVRPPAKAVRRSGQKEQKGSAHLRRQKRAMESAKIDMELRRYQEKWQRQEDLINKIDRFGLLIIIPVVVIFFMILCAIWGE